MIKWIAEKFYIPQGTDISICGIEGFEIIPIENSFEIAYISSFDGDNYTTQKYNGKYIKILNRDNVFRKDYYLDKSFSRQRDLVDKCIKKQILEYKHNNIDIDRCSKLAIDANADNRINVINFNDLKCLFDMLFSFSDNIMKKQDCYILSNIKYLNYIHSFFRRNKKISNGHYFDFFKAKTEDCKGKGLVADCNNIPIFSSDIIPDNVLILCRENSFQQYIVKENFKYKNNGYDLITNDIYTIDIDRVLILKHKYHNF